MSAVEMFAWGASCGICLTVFVDYLFEVRGNGAPLDEEN